jgi:raffinose/stachyose/melibiose transport system substrate-binding protein
MRVQTRWRAAAAATAALLFAGGLAACSTPETAPAEEQDSFVYWSMWREDEPVAKVIQQAIGAFEEETGITVDVEWQGRDVLTKLKAALNTNNIPDLVDKGFPEIKAVLGLSKEARDLSDVYDMEIPGSDGRTVRDAVPEAYDELNTADSLIVVPYYVSAFSWWFSGTAYPDLVENPPATWDDFTGLFDEVKANGQAPIAADADLLSYDSSFVNAALVSAVGPGNLHEIVADHDAEGWDDSKVRQAVEAIAELAEDGDYIEGYDSSKYPAMEKSWAAGNAAFLHMGSWVPYAFPELAEDYDLHAFGFPQLGNNTAVPVTTYGYAIPTAAKSPDAAKQFIAFLMGTEWLTKLSNEALILTPDPTIEVPELLLDQQRLLAENEVYLADDGIVADFPDLTTRFATLNQGLITGQLSADDYIKQVVDTQVQYWKLNG